MRILLLPLRTRFRDPDANFRHLEERFAEVGRYNPDLVCLPECTLTGYVYEVGDLRRFAEPIPGPTTGRLGGLARRYGVFLCFGLVEAAGVEVYDSALLLDRQGRILLRHRKIEERSPFACGRTVGAVDTELGRLSMLICGDLFNKDAIAQVDRSTDLVIVPMARSFDGRSPDGKRWESEERKAYLNAVRALGLTTALVNSFEIGEELPSFGGALVVDGRGNILAESEHGTDQIITCDLSCGCTSLSFRRNANPSSPSS